MDNSAYRVRSETNHHISELHSPPSKLKTYGFVISIIVGIGALAVGAARLAGYFHVGALSSIDQIDAIILMATGMLSIFCVGTVKFISSLGKLVNNRHTKASNDSTNSVQASVQRLPNFLDIIDPASDHAIPVPTQHRPPAYDICFFQLDIIGYDICVSIASFLPPRDRFQSMTVSKKFHHIVKSNSLWNNYLGHSDYRIWGATQRPSDHNRSLKRDNNQNNVNSLNQLRAYHQLRKEKLDDFFDYLARLMPGGPIAFKSIPQMQLTNVSVLLPENMTSPIMRGTDEQGCCFFALRVKNRAHENAGRVIFNIY